MAVHTITIPVTDNYTGDLKKRLREYGISHGMLAREMDVSASQLSRWFNKPIQPRMDNVFKIERAVAAIRVRMHKAANKAK